MKKIIPFLILGIIALSPFPAFATTYEDVTITVLDAIQPPNSQEEEITITVLDAEEPPPPDPEPDRRQEDVIITVIDVPVPPKIISFAPLDGSIFYKNDNINILPVLNSSAPESLEYQFSIDADIKQPWSGKASYSWANITPGRHDIKIEVKDNNGQDVVQPEVYVYRRPFAPPE